MDVIKFFRYLLRRNIIYDFCFFVDDDIVLQGEKKLRKVGILILYEFNYNFSLLFVKCVNIRIMDFEKWFFVIQFNFDGLQYKVVQRVFINEFVIIQGLFGIGKMYIGLKIVRVLLYNYKVWNINLNGVVEFKLMLIVCYMNYVFD